MFTGRLLLHRHWVRSLAAFIFLTLLAGSDVGSVQKAALERMGQVVDWSNRHILYPQGNSLRALALSQRDPRAYWNYLRLSQAAEERNARLDSSRPMRPVRVVREHADWSAALGAAGTAPNMFPAKYSFNVNATPSCTSDYAVFAINVAPSGTQANIAAFNNLYSGAGAAPTCSTPIAASPAGATEAGTTVTIKTSSAHGYTVNETVTVAGAGVAGYNGTWLVTSVPTTTTFTYTTAAGLAASGGGTASGPTVAWAFEAGTTRLRSSPIISLDGTKVAFVSGSNPAIFYVLTPGAAPGPSGTVTAPATPAAAQLASVTLTTGADSDSSPFVDYYNDIAYVGTNNGRVFKITGVFTGTPTLAGAPWPLLAGATTLTGPVIDFNTGNLFVGSANGNLYGFNPATGAAIASSPLAVGSGRADGGITDSPVVDVTNGLLYVATGDNAAIGGHALETNAIVVQASTSSFATVQVATIGTTEVAPIHAGAFNAAYFSGSANGIGTTSAWYFYVCGVNAAVNTRPFLYRVGFTGTPPVMNTTVDATSVQLSTNNGEVCSPLTEFQNGVDRLFLGLLTSAQVEFFDISTTTTPTRGGTGAVAPVAEAGGTSGIIVDNVSAAAQASSIYFTTQANSANCGTHRCAVKLTQGGLQ